jgi:hypothetical protein
MVVVSIYYYNRYQTIDNYLESENVMEEVWENIHSLDVDKEKIIKRFTEDRIIKEEKQYIQQKQLIFLWKKFTYEKDIFVNSFANYNEFLINLFSFLKCEYNRESNNNVLYGYYSFDLPYVDDFKLFWNENFYECENETNLELNEILFLYNKHGKMKRNNLNETLIKLILQCFYSKHEVLSNKFINGVKCKLWDKRKDDVNIEDNLNIIYKLYLSTTKSDYRISKIYFQTCIECLSSKNKILPKN